MKTTIKFIALVAILALSWYYNQGSHDKNQKIEEHSLESFNTEQTLRNYYEQRISGKMIKLSAKVIKLLADDLEAPRHQKFIIKVASDMTILVTHNIDLADRINSLKVGDNIQLYGQYEWNQRGGIVHWTHHDPKGKRQAGWIQHQGKTYK